MTEPVKAEAWALRAATLAVSFFPWFAGGVAAILAINGQDAGAVIAADSAVFGGGAQIINSTRRQPPK